jgi:hypothetical protein
VVVIVVGWVWRIAAVVWGFQLRAGGENFVDRMNALRLPRTFEILFFLNLSK